MCRHYPGYQGFEGLLHVFTRLRTDLEQWQAALSCQVLQHLRLHSPGQVSLVGEKCSADIRTAVLAEFLQPALRSIDLLRAGEVDYNHDSLCLAVVGGGDGSEAFLSRCVVDLRSESLLANAHLPTSIVHSNGAGVPLTVQVLAVPLQ